MGIQGLMKLLSEECPGCVKEQELDNFTGRKIAIDASMAMYQFLIAVRQMGPGGSSAQLTNEAGEVTSHIQGMFNRTIRLMSAGIKPVYVFDGKPPQMKGGELAKRMARRAKAESDLATAKESGDAEDMDKYSRRLVKVTKQHNEDCKQLLRLMGVPVVEAPCEAESQCAELAKNGKVYGAATEDMDALTFRTPKLLRKMTFSGTKQPILEIDCELMLTGLGLSYPEFIDLCILCGCDYTDSIKGIGPKTALKLIRQYKNIESVIVALKRTKKHVIPEDWKSSKILKDPVDDKTDVEVEAEVENKENSVVVDAGVAVAEDNDIVEADAESKVVVETSKTDFNPDMEAEADAVVEKGDSDDDIDWSELEESDVNGKVKGDTEAETETIDEVDEEVDMDLYDIIPPMYEQARNLFVDADVTPANDVPLSWDPPKEEELRKFLVEKMGFNEERVASGIKKLVEAQAKKAQKRMDSFFSVVPQDEASKKRKLDIANKQAMANNKNKKGKSGKPAFAGKKR